MYKLRGYNECVITSKVAKECFTFEASSGRLDMKSNASRHCKIYGISIIAFRNCSAGPS